MALSEKQLYAKIERIVKKYGRIQIDFIDYYHSRDEWNLRRRKIYNDGRCYMAYRGSGYTKCTSFGDSCFAQLSLRETLESMRGHDDENDIKMYCIYYGPHFKYKFYPYKSRPKLKL